MELHSENKVSRANLMKELIEGEQADVGPLLDHEIPELSEALKTPEILESFKLLAASQNVKSWKTVKLRFHKFISAFGKTIQCFRGNEKGDLWPNA